MKIKSLKIGAFGKLKNVNITLDDKITVIHGKNEAGKSSVAAFIRYMLYGFSSTAKKNLSENDKKHYMPWDGDSVSGELEFTSENGSNYTAVRKNAARAQSTILDADGMPAYETVSAGDIFFGLDEPVYRKTAFIGQTDISLSDSGELDRAINNMVNSADEEIDADVAIEKLNKLKKELLGARQNSGRIYKIQCELDELKREKEKWQGGHMELLAAESSLNDTKSKLEENNAKIALLEKESYNLKCLLASRKLSEINDLKQKAEKSKAMLDTEYRSAVRGDFVPDRSFCSELEVAIRSYVQSEKAFINAYKSASDAKERYNKAYSDPAQKKLSERLAALGMSPDEADKRLDALAKKAKNSLVAAVVLTLLVVTIPVAAFFWIKRFKDVRVLKSFVLQLGANSAKELKGMLKANTAYSGAAQAVNDVLETALKQQNDAQKALDEDKKTLFSLVLRAGYSLDENNLAEQTQKLLSDMLILVERLENLKKQCNEDYIRYSTLFKGLDVEQLSRLAAEVETDANIRPVEVVSRELNFYTKQNEELKLKERELEKKAAVLSGTLPKPAELESRISSLKQQRELLKEKYSELELAASCLETASEKMKKSASPKISARAGELFGYVTDGKYRGLYTDSDMNLSFIEKASAEVRNAQYLSTGTLELAYISLRISLCENLYKERPTLVFDDAFSHMDDERLERMLQFLESISDKFQIVIMSCHDREARYFKDKAKIIDFVI